MNFWVKRLPKHSYGKHSRFISLLLVSDSLLDASKRLSFSTKQHMAELISDELKEHVIPPAPATTHTHTRIHTRTHTPFQAFEMLCCSGKPTFRAFNEPKGNCCA